ncbi:MAG: hypothetical protein K1X51_00235 [Rhodospirillaceae bacterium]|nr:hypothetical protein [Rhodospirillaceae bacterium]
MRIALAALLLLCAPALAQDLRPERAIRNTTVSSQHDPPVHISVPDTATYVGADRWILYGVADAELHLFVEADANRVVTRSWWIQFEEVIPEKPESKYTYSGATADLDGLPFFVRGRFGPTQETGRPGSDAEHMRKLLIDKGYTAPAEMVNVRFVHIPDELKRKELMIIYAEAMPDGLTSAQFIKDGKITDAWAPVEKDLIERARRSITLRKMD